MLEKALKGSSRYWGLIIFWIAVIAVGGYAYSTQLREGLTVTGLSRDVPWGFYIAQFTFLVGVAASAVMVVLPYYLHNYKAFGKMVILGEFLAISAVVMCMLFIVVDMGQPMRVVNVMLHPSPTSMIFWDATVLSGYLGLNLVIGFVTFGAEKKGVAPPKWIKPFIYLSIPWAVSIHTVTAFLYSGLEGRTFWMTAILAPRFLASAFASGPSLLIILALILKRFTSFDPGKEALQKLGTIVTYALCVNVFFVGVELFTGIYPDIPEHLHHFHYLFLGYPGKTGLATWMWISQLLVLGSLVMLLFPKTRQDEKVLGWVCGLVIIAIWIEKGMGMVVTGFVPTPLGKIPTYVPSLTEGMVALGVYGLGALILTVLYKIAVTVREEMGS